MLMAVRFNGRQIGKQFFSQLFIHFDNPDAITKMKVVRLLCWRQAMHEVVQEAD